MTIIYAYVNYCERNIKMKIPKCFIVMSPLFFWWKCSFHEGLILQASFGEDTQKTILAALALKEVTIPNSPWCKQLISRRSGIEA